MAERPVECSQCKKPVKVIYKEIVGNAITVTEMCVDCPIFQEKLHGTPPKDQATAGGFAEKEAGLYCGRCHTSLDAVKMGNPLGCSECYNVFSDQLISQLIEEQKIPTQLKKGLMIRKNQPIHIGQSPSKQTTPIPSSNKFAELNEALNDALRKENYEEAAKIRDQIKALTEKKDGGKV